MMEKDSIARLLNPDGYCVPELKDFFKKRKPVRHEERSLKKRKTKVETVSTFTESDTLNSNPQFEEEANGDTEKEDRVTDRRLKREKKKKKQLWKLDEEKESRTVFLGNLPIKWEKKKIKRYFSKYGAVENLRLRCAPVADPRVPKKVAVITKNFHPERTSINAFLRFVDKESAISALRANGSFLGEHRIRVDLAVNNLVVCPDRKRAVFVGNVPLSTENNALWTLFENCGPIESVHIPREKITGMGRGFAYINFKDRDAVELALKMNGELLDGRELRITRYLKKTTKAEKKKIKEREAHVRGVRVNPGRGKSGQGARTAKSPGQAADQGHAKKSPGGKIVKYQGQTVSGVKKIKKKKKMSKVEKRRKLLIDKLAGGLSKNN
ncbi:RNA-binding protein 34-like [Bacillus rossius redtenbacheri]|uniref:RNA-binding protein 34-like n=1 Tax=Bacillus rossius redtenbacheri TaxID=93214 RepID=UPI002FDE03BC